MAERLRLIARDTDPMDNVFMNAAQAARMENDGRPDLYLSVRQSENVLYRNAGPAEGLRARNPGCGWRFTNVAREAHVNEQIHSFPTWFFDYDNDGNEDLFVSGYLITELGDITRDVLGLPTTADRARLYHNNGDGTFADVTHAAHLDHVLQAMGSNYGDFDNDGWLDMLIGTGNPASARSFRTAPSATTAGVRSRKSRPRAASATSRRGTASRSATSTTMATRTSITPSEGRMNRIISATPFTGIRGTGTISWS